MLLIYRLVEFVFGKKNKKYLINISENIVKMIPKEYQEYLKYGMYGGAGLGLAVEFQNLKLGNIYI